MHPNIPSNISRKSNHIDNTLHSETYNKDDYQNPKQQRITNHASSHMSYPVKSTGTVQSRELNDCFESKDLSHRRKSHVNSNNFSSLIGSKAASLKRMKASNIPTPKFETINAQILQEIEDIPVQIFTLKENPPYWDKYESFTGCITSLKQWIIKQSDQEIQKRLLKNLSEFIGSESFYQQVKNHKSAQNIRAHYKLLNERINDGAVSENSGNMLNALKKLSLNKSESELVPQKVETKALATINANSTINDDQGWESNARKRPIIVRSSAINEDGYGAARAGQYHSEVHGETDILRSCLRVLASGICLEGGPMAIILQECIECRFGGVVMGYSSLHDNTLKIEYGPGQPKSVVSGEYENQPHHYAIRRAKSKITDIHFEKGNIAVIFGLQNTDHGCGYVEIEQTTPDTTEPDDPQLPTSILEDIHEKIEYLESWRCCPVDVEIAIDKKDKLYYLQERPITRLSGGINFIIPIPKDFLVQGELISEGCCSGKPLVVREPVTPAYIPEGSILVAKNGQKWMLANSVLERVNGFVFTQCASNSHVGIQLREKNKACMTTAGVWPLNNLTEEVTLVCGKFKKESVGLLLEGNQENKLKQSMVSSGDLLVEDLHSYDLIDSSDLESNLNRPDTAFEWLSWQNDKMLQSFDSKGVISQSLKNCVLFSMSPQRQLIAQKLKDSVQCLQHDIKTWLIAYQKYLGIAADKVESKEIKEFTQMYYDGNEYLLTCVKEYPQLQKRLEDLEQKITKKMKDIVVPFYKEGVLPNENISFGDWTENCQELYSTLQTLNQPKNIDKIMTIHDIIFYLHRRIIEALPLIAVYSGVGKVSHYLDNSNLPMEYRRKTTFINFNDDIDQSFVEDLAKLCWEKYIINMDNVLFLIARLGMHAAVIEMFEHAEGGKGRTLRLKFSDDIWNTVNYCIDDFQGRIKRIFFLAQMLRDTASLQKLDIDIRFCKNLEQLNVEVTNIESKEIMKEAFKRFVFSLDALRDLNCRLKDSNLDDANTVWSFDILEKRINDGFSTEENRFAFKHCLMLMQLNSGTLSNPHIYPSILSETYRRFAQCALELKDNTRCISFNPQGIKAIEDVKVIVRSLDKRFGEEILQHLLLINPEKILPFALSETNWFNDRKFVLSLVLKRPHLFRFLQIYLPKYKNDEQILSAISEINKDRDEMLNFARKLLTSNRYT